MPHQLEAMKYCRRMPNPFLAMEMRLGKTLVAIRYLQSTYFGPKLVVAPLTVLLAWQKELELEGLNALWPNWNSEAEMSTQVLGDHWYLINYERLRVRPWVAELPWTAVVLDESTMCRNPKADIVKLLVQKFRLAKTRMCLSGNPAPEGPLDWYCQMQFLNNSFCQEFSYWTFRQRYFRPPFPGAYEWVPKPGVLEMMKSQLDAQVFFLKRSQAGLGNKKIREQRVVEMEPEQKALYESMEKRFYAEANSLQKISTKWATVRVLRLQQIAGGVVRFDNGTVKVFKPKINELIDLLKGELKNEQVVVWFRFNAEILSVAHSLRAAGIKPLSITGSTSLALRKDKLARFQRGNCRVLLLQIRCGKFGLDLSSSDTAIYFSNSYAQEDRIQSEDRIEHPRKRMPLLVLDLVARQTVDSEVLGALLDKKSMSAAFFFKHDKQLSLPNH